MQDWIQDCFSYSTKYISKFPKTEKELRIKLRKKGYSEQVIKKTMSKLKNHGFVNDKKFTQMYIDSELIRKGKPVYKIKGKLLDKGIDESILDKKIDENRDKIIKNIKEQIKKEIKKYKKKDINWFDIIQKIGRRGYKFSRIKDTIDEMENNK